MPGDTASRLPALPPAAGLLAGVRLAGWLPAGPWPAGLLLAAAGLAVWGRRRCPRAAGAAALALCALVAGAALERHDAAAYRARAAQAGLPDDGGGIDTHFRGALLAPPERALGGERRLRLRGRIEGHAEWLEVRLQVRASPDDAMRGLDRLRAGDRVRVWCRLRSPLAPRNPGSRDVALRARGLDAVGSVKSARVVELVARGAPRPARWAGEVKRAARLELDRLLGADSSARSLAGALLLGDRAALDPREATEFRRSGLMHVIAISGLHVGLLLWGLVALARRARIGPAARFVLLALFLCGFAMLVGGRASVLRAALGAALLLLGRGIGREGAALNTLAALAAALVALRPAAIDDVGFRLTFAATAGILLLARPIAERLPAPRPLALSLAVGIAAYLATAPLAVASFGLAAPVGVVASLVAVPLCAAILLAGYLALLAAGVPLLAAGSAGVLGAACRALAALARGCAAAPCAAIALPAPSSAFLLLYYSLLVLSVAAGRLRGPAAVLAGLAVAALHVGPPPVAPGCSEAAVLDVGQGLSVALRAAGGEVLLVDAGPSTPGGFDSGERIVLPFLLEWGVRRVDVLLVSHDHLDHIGGAFAILREMEVGELWLGPAWAGSAPSAALADLARERGAAVVQVAAGQRTSIGALPVEVLAPERSRLPTDDNARSVVVRAGGAAARILVPGDIDARGERRLVEQDAALRSDALVLAHHGSRNASSAEFLRATGARLAIVSAGRANPFGHPHEETVRRVRRCGARLLRTGDGWVHLVARADGWRVASEIEDLDRHRHEAEHEQ